MEKEFRLKVYIKNNRLIRLRENLGLTIRKASELCGISYQTYILYENFTYDPIGKFSPSHKWKPSAIKISNFYRVVPEYIWPEAALEIEKNTAEIELSAMQVGRLIGQFTENAALPSGVIYEKKKTIQEKIEKSLSVLDLRDKEIIKYLYGLEGEEDHTHAETGRKFGVSRERIRQIEARALRSMYFSSLSRSKNRH